MSILSAIKRAKEIQPEPFIAPLFEGNTNVIAYHGGVPRSFSVNMPEAGWHLLIPVQARDGRWYAIPERFAYPSEYLEYLDQLPRFYVSMLVRLDVGTWLATPFNSADATQRGWPDGQPMSVYLVREAVRRYDLVEARQLGRVLLYGQMAMRGNLHMGERDSRNAVGIVSQYEALLQEKEAIKAREQQLATVDGQIRDQVEFAGGKLLAWDVVGEGFEVTWEWDGHTLRTRVNREMGVTSVGFCTAGTARQHTLASTVALLREGIHRNHYAVRRLDDQAQEAWLEEDEHDNDWDD